MDDWSTILTVTATTKTEQSKSDQILEAVLKILER